ncbi:peptidoglycan recognition protein [Streptomyces glaucescens]|uniref:peptidoglycan recognition protein family protein n=1 Tax=Streptomyces glaucescens TaxID=1907 RepID=UPI00344D3940
MRAFLASSIGVTCAAALALPLTLPAAPATARPGGPPEAGAPAVPGGTQSLPLVPLTTDRPLGSAPVQGLPRRDVRRFSMVGVVWDDPADELHGEVQVRVRAAGTGTWSGWQDIETHNADHAADPGTAERASARVRGGTAPLWVGDSDGVEVRIRATAGPGTPGDGTGTSTAGNATGTPGTGTPGTGTPGTGTGTPGSGTGTEAHGTGTGTPGTGTGTPGNATGPDVQGAQASLPPGLRVELVDPGAAADTPAQGTPAASSRLGTLSPETVAASEPNVVLAPLGATEIPELDRTATERELLTLAAGELTEEQRAKPKIGPRPQIVTRRGWGANEKLREKTFIYTKKVKAAFVHHSATGNGYRCSQAPSVIRGIYRYHVRSMGWRDIGYNFLVDKCGKIYEGRAGGVAKPVMGAHTLGFNTNSMGVAVLGTFDSAKPTKAAVKALGRLTAWKLGLHGADPSGRTYLKSGGGNLYRKGKNVRLHVISGHRDGFATECPGRRLYAKLGSVRGYAAYYQGRG